MASPEHPGSPGWAGPVATGPEHPRPGPEGHLGGLGQKERFENILNTNMYTSNGARREWGK